MIYGAIAEIVDTIVLKLKAGMHCVFPKAKGSNKAKGQMTTPIKAKGLISASTQAKALTQNQANAPIKAKGSINPLAQTNAPTATTPNNENTCKPKRIARKHNKKKRGY